MRRLPFFVLVILPAFTSTLYPATVLVLPFFNQSKSPNLDWIGESLAETIRESLASRGLLALSRDDRLEAYRRLAIRSRAVLTRASVIKLGQALDASNVVFGHYELSGSSLRIEARVLDLAHTREGPEFGETGVLEDLASLETHLAWQSLVYLAPKTAPSEEEFRRERPPVRVDAIESYVRGLLAASEDRKYRLFTQATRLDSRFTAPCFQLGRISFDRKEYGVAAGWLQKVSPADSHFLEAMFLLGLCRYHMGDFAGAEKCFEIDAAAVPLNEVFNNLGAAQSRAGSPAAIGNFQKAVEGDGADPDYHFNLGYALWKRGDLAKAAESFQAVLQRSPGDLESAALLERCRRGDGPRRGDPAGGGRERIKRNFEETAYRQLKAELESKGKD